MIKINDEYVSIVVDDARKLFDIAKNSNQRWFQLSKPRLEVWELFPDELKEQPKIDTVYYRADYVGIDSIKISGVARTGLLTREAIKKLLGNSFDVGNAIKSETPIRIIKLLEDNYETI